MRVQFFYDNDYTHESIQKMQEKINDFIKFLDVVDIKFTSEGAENGHAYLVMVIYK
mgnify:FL=1